MLLATHTFSIPGHAPRHSCCCLYGHGMQPMVALPCATHAHLQGSPTLLEAKNKEVGRCSVNFNISC
jgi:hypothetical protein